MKIEIKVQEDECFSMSGVELSNSPITGEVTMKVEETPKEDPVVEPTKDVAPLNNYKSTNSFNIFEGTSWGGTHQGPGNIGR